MTDRDLLHLHLQAGWYLSLPALDQPLHDFVLTGDLPAWSLYLATCAKEQIAIWRPEIGPTKRRRLRSQATAATPVWEETLKMRREVVFHYPRLSSRQLAYARASARVLTADDADRIDDLEAGSSSYFLDPHVAPCLGCMVDGHLLSIAHSARQTATACELGINTLPQARRRGYATAATILWTALVQEKGLVPIYSAFAWNTASLQLAKSIGYLPRIDGVYGPAPATDE